MPPPVPVATSSVSGREGCSVTSRTSRLTRPNLKLLQFLPPLVDLYTPSPNVPAYTVPVRTGWMTIERTEWPVERTLFQSTPPSTLRNTPSLVPQNTESG